MIPEVAEYERRIEECLRQICDRLDGLTPTQLNWGPPLAGGNSTWVLATHTLGNARAWVLGIAAGQPQRRDRTGEFASSGTDPALLRSDVDAFLREMSSALAPLAAADLERRVLPAKELWGEGEPREISVRYALLQVIEHAWLHLGHIQITADLAAAT